MAKKNGFDTVRLASERLAGKTWEQQMAEHNGNGGHKPENGKPVVDSGTKKEQPAKKDNLETKKVKNPAETDRAKEQNERVSRERAEIKESVDGSLRLVANALAEPGLSAKDRARLQWIQKSVEGAKNKIVDGENYSVEVMDNNGKVKAHRLEGLPVDELITVVQRLRTLTEKQVRQAHRTEAGIEGSRKVKEKYELESVRANISGEEAKKKMAWFEVLSKLPVKDQLKEEAYKEVEAWEEADRKKAGEEGKTFSGYDSDFKKQQLGEALRQRVEKYLKIDDRKLKAELDARTKTLGKYHNLAKVLSESSLPYFAFHYPKNYKKDGEAASPLGEGQKREQHLYTERESNLIAKDQEYKAMLLERYIGENKLPQGFDKMDELRQNYELAMLALESRRVLVLPKEQQVPDEILETNIATPATPTETAPKPETTTTSKPEPQLVPKNKPVVVETTQPEIEIITARDRDGVYVPVVLGPEVGPGGRVEKDPIKTEKNIFLIDISEIAKRMAWTKAEEKLRNHFDHKGGFFGKVVKNAWKGLSENHYLLKYYQEAKKEIENDNNLMKAISERLSGTQVPGAGTRVSSEYLEMLDKVVLEYKKDVADTQRELGDSMNDNPEVKNKFAELLYRYRSNKWEDEYKGLDKRAAVELFVKKEIATAIKDNGSAKWTTDKDRAREAKGLLYASNFYEILESVDKNYKEQIDAAVKGVMDKNPEANVEAVRDAIAKQVEGVQGLNLQLGLKERDIINNRPKGILNAFEMITDSVENHKVLGKIILNPLVMGAVATVTSMGAQRIIKWAAVGAATVATGGSFWIPLGVGSAVGGVYRAIKRGKDTEYDTAQELRQKTLGGKGSDVLGKEGERSYDAVVMSFKEAMTVVASMKDKKTFTDAEKQQLAKIYARLQLERDTLADNKNKYTKVDLFSMDEDQGKRYGSNVSAKADLKVALKELGIKEQDLHAMAEVEKIAIMDVINQVNEKQGDFKRKEMLVSGLKGAVMGFAGGILAQEAIHLGGEQVEKLWGGSYFKSHHTSFDKIVDGVKGTKFYQSNFDGHPVMAGGAAVEHVVTGSRDQTPMEWMKYVKGHIAGGNIEKIHTQNWYDNPTGDTPHSHNDNELRFYISKDSAGSVHFKVPIKGDGSWNENGWADLDKASTEGRIKMLFVPDGNNYHDAIVMDVDPATHEVIIPKDSNIANLFDSATGRPKGTGFFGLAEQTGVRSDGSKNYVWISSENNNQSNIDFGKVNTVQEFIPDKPAVGPVEYDQALPTVPPQRKVFYRPGENEKEEKKQKKKVEKEAKKKADKEKKDKEQAEKEAKKKAGDQKAGAKGNSGGNESGGGGGGSQEEGTKKAAGETTEAKAPEFKGDVLKRYLNPQYAAALLELYGQHTGLKKIDKKAIRFVVEGDAHKGKILKPDKATKAERAEAVWQMEQALIAGSVIKQNQIEEFYGDVVEEETKNEAAAKAAAPKPGAEAPPKPGASETTPPQAVKDKVPAGTFNSPEAGGAEFGSASKELLEKTGKRVHYIMDGKLMPDSDKLKVLKAFGSALDQLPKNVRDGLLDKTNWLHRDTELSKGILLSFEAGATKPAFGAKNFLRIPPDAQVEDIKKVLEDFHKRMLELRAKREADGGNSRKPANPTK